MNWTQHAHGQGDAYISRICYSPELNLFCATGSYVPYIMISSDGIAWTAVNNSVTDEGNWYDICWAPELGLFCAVGHGNTMVSSNGVDWTLSSHFAQPLYSVCWSPALEMFCCTGYYRAYISTDGLNWTPTNNPAWKAAAYWTRVCWSPELEIFCTVADYGNVQVAVSSNGMDWTQGTKPNAGWYGWTALCWSPALGLFCASKAWDDIGDYDVMTSADGLNWVGHTSSPLIDTSADYMCWSEKANLFCMTSQADAVFKVLTSEDGIVWTLEDIGSVLDWTIGGVCAADELNIFCLVLSPLTYVMHGAYEVQNGEILPSLFINRLECFLFRIQSDNETPQTVLSRSDLANVVLSSSINPNIGHSEIKILGGRFDQDAAAIGKQEAEIKLIYPIRRMAGVQPDFCRAFRCADFTISSDGDYWLLQPSNAGGESATIWHYEGRQGSTNLHKITNVKTDWQLRGRAGEAVYAEFAGKGIYAEYTNGTQPGARPCYAPIPAFYDATVLINGSAYKVLTFGLSGGQRTEVTDDSTVATGCGQAKMAGRAIKLNATVYMEAQATIDPIAALKAGTEGALQLYWGVDSMCKIDGSYSQIIDAKRRPENGIMCWALKLQLNRNHFEFRIKK